MTFSHQERLKEVFVTAAALPATERAGYLDGVCAGDGELRAAVESLLAAEELPTAPLFGPAGVLGGGGVATAGRIGRFTILETIGAGGMGVVYKAEQEEPRRVVAVKVMRAGTASFYGWRRFREESRNMARLEHPGIARIYESGIHDTRGERLPYFAMEYIAHAKPITEYVRENGLSIRRALELMATVCDAVEHGHKKGVVHRDLKPQNILVGSEGVAKVIDFGVARLIGPDQNATTQHTATGQLIGTIQYMSPEQLEGGPWDVDTRSDVYALGVVLYEVLTGRRPHEFGSGSIPQEMRAIVERSPTRLSVIDPHLRGDVETVVLKALEREQCRRYQSAADLAADIRRYLALCPVLARRPSLWYQVRMFERRKRAVFWAVVVAVISMAGLVAAGVISRQRAFEARDRAEHVASRLVEFLESQDPTPGNWKAVPFLDAAGVLAERLDGQLLAEQPELTVPLYRVIAGVLAGNGHADQARALAERALRLSRSMAGGDHPHVSASLETLGGIVERAGSYTQAEQLFAEAAAINRRLYPGGHIELARSLSSLAGVVRDAGRYQEAERLNAEALQVVERLYPGDHPAVVSALGAYAHVLELLDRSQEAKPLYYRAYEMNTRLDPRDSRGILRNLLALAWVHAELGERENAIRFGVEHLEMHRRLAKGESLGVANALNMLAGMHRVLNEPEESERRFAESLAMCRRLCQGDHRDVARGLDDLATARERLGRLEDAEGLYREAMAMWRRLEERDEPALAVTMANLARCLGSMGRRDEALEQARAAAAIVGRTLPSESKVRKQVAKVLSDLE